MKCISNNEGFTLTEVLAAITLLSIVIVCSLGLIGQSSSFTSKNDTHLKATNLARKTIAYLEANNIKVTNPAEDVDLANYHLTDENHLFPFATYTQNDEEKQVNVYRVEIKVYDSKEKRNLLSHTYGYLEGGQQ